MTDSPMMPTRHFLGDKLTWKHLAASACLALQFACQRPTPPTQAGSAAIRKTVPTKASPTSDREAWRSTVPRAGTESAWTYPVPTVATLANHLTVYVLPRPGGPVSFSVVIRHGGSDVPAKQAGLASLVAQMMAEATKSRSHHVLSEAAEALGSTLVGDANRDYLHLTLDTLPADVEKGIELLADTLMAPALAEEDFARLQKQHLDDLVAERQAPMRLASLVGLRVTLGEQLGEPVGGGRTKVSRLRVNDVRAWYRKFVYPEAVSLLAVGPTEPGQVLRAAERFLGKWRAPKAQVTSPPKPALSTTTQIFTVDRPGSVQSALFVAQTCPKRGEPGHAARQVLDNVIGGQFTSRINHNLREEHAYTYGAHSTIIAARHFGLLSITTSVETDVTVPAIQEIIRELTDLRGPISAKPIGNDEFTRAKTGIVRGLGAHLEDSHRLLADLEQVAANGLSAKYWADYLSEVRQLDLAAVAAESARIAGDQLVIVVVGDLARIRGQLEAAHLSFSNAPAAWLD